MSFVDCALAFFLLVVSCVRVTVHTLGCDASGCHGGGGGCDQTIDARLEAQTGTHADRFSDESQSGIAHLLPLSSTQLES